MNQDCLDIVVEFRSNDARTLLAARRLSSAWHSAVESTLERHIASCEAFPPAACDEISAALLLVLFPNRLRSLASSVAQRAALAVSRRRPEPFPTQFPNFILADGAMKRAVWEGYLDLSSGPWETIPEGAFADARVTDLRLPPCVNKMGRLAFAQFQTLAVLDLGSTQIKQICSDHFDGAQLTAMVLPPSLTDIEMANVKISQLLDLSACCIQNFSPRSFRDLSVGTLKLPRAAAQFASDTFVRLHAGVLDGECSDGLNKLPPNVFECAGIGQLKLPPTLESIGMRSFYGLTGAKEIQLPAVTCISAKAFAMSSIQRIGVGPNLRSLLAGAMACTQLERLDLSACVSISELPCQVFMSSTIEQLQLPRTLTALGEGCFEGLRTQCLDLSKCIIREIPVRCFACGTFGSLVMPRCVALIRDCAFEHADIHASLDLARGDSVVKELRARAFDNARVRGGIRFPHLLEQLAPDALLRCRADWLDFSRCERLRVSQLNLPKNTTVHAP